MAKVICDWKTLYSFITDAFVGVGVPRKDAEICTDVLLASDKRGIESHGVNRFKPIYIDRIKAGIQNPVTNFEIVRETPTTAVVDGHDGMGQVIGYKSMSMAIEKAKKYGMGMVAVRNSCHYGIAGYYATMATDAGCIGITGTNARPSIAPTFGVENMLGTNPLTVGMPTDEDFPFLLDCATSITQRGKIEYFARIGKDTPAGMVIGRDGSALTDSVKILDQLNCGEAALAPLGGIGEELAGYKGYGYATVVEILSAALQQGKCLAVKAIAQRRRRDHPIADLPQPNTGSGQMLLHVRQQPNDLICTAQHRETNAVDFCRLDMVQRIRHGLLCKASLLAFRKHRDHPVHFHPHGSLLKA